MLLGLSKSLVKVVAVLAELEKVKSRDLQAVSLPMYSASTDSSSLFEITLSADKMKHFLTVFTSAPHPVHPHDFDLSKRRHFAK